MKKGILMAVSTVAGAAAGSGVATYRATQRTKQARGDSDRHLALYLLMNQWVRVKQENKSIAGYLEKKGYKEIAVYGMNYVGETLLKELEGSGIMVKYAIDKNANSIYSDVEVITPDSEFDKVDAIIVTPITYFDEIEALISERMDCPVVSIEDILYVI